MSCAFLAHLQRQGSRQGQDGGPSEVKQRQGRDETTDWPTSVVCIYCSYVFNVSHHNIKTINVISSTLQTAHCLLRFFNPIHCILHNIYTVHKVKPGSISDTTKNRTGKKRARTHECIHLLFPALFEIYIKNRRVSARLHTVYTLPVHYFIT